MLMTDPDKTRLISLIDFTRLLDHDNESDIREFCKKASTPLGPVAALCVYPEFITAAKNTKPTIPVATVANFPSGNDALPAVEQSILSSLEKGADEIDVVMPYKRLIVADMDYVIQFLNRCRELTKNYVLKIIIETAALDEAHIAQATQLVADCGADFVKTSTGKMAGASLEAVTIVLETLALLTNPPGIKISGGIHTPEQAQSYLDLIEKHMGRAWITPTHVRLGSSRLIDALEALPKS